MVLDKIELEGLFHGERNARLAERYHALYVLAVGETVARTALLFHRSEDTIRAWRDSWEEKHTVVDDSRSGREPVFSKEDKKGLVQLMKKSSPQKHGLNASFWSTRELQQYYKLKGKSVCRETIRKILIQLGAHYVKAQLSYPEADEKARLAFAKQFIKDLVSKAKNTVLLFQDEMSAECSPRKGYGWTFEKRLIVQAPNHKKRLNVFGAVNPLKGEVVQMPSKHAKTNAFIRFLNKILKCYPHKKIWMYTDNLPVHKSAKVKQFLQKHSRLQLKFLPAYSPDLNPQEPWWKHQRLKLLNNRYFNTTHKLSTNITWFGKQTPSQEIKQICNLNPIQNLIP